MPHARETRREYEAAPAQRFRQHKRNAASRGIPFLMTFEEWWSWWQEDGRWERRGREAACLVMARKGDAGPYALWNIYPATQRQNSLDAAANSPNWRERVRGMMAASALLDRPHLKDRPNHPMRKPVETPAGGFPSASLAADHHGITANAAARRAASKIMGWSYARSEQRP